MINHFDFHYHDHRKSLWRFGFIFFNLDSILAMHSLFPLRTPGQNNTLRWR